MEDMTGKVNTQENRKKGLHMGNEHKTKLEETKLSVLTEPDKYMCTTGVNTPFGGTSDLIFWRCSGYHFVSLSVLV